MRRTDGWRWTIIGTYLCVGVMSAALSGCGGPRPPASTPEQTLAILALADADTAQREQLIADGQRTFTRMNCALCHTTDGSSRTGPSLQGLFEKPVTLATGQSLTPDRRYAWQSIAQPTSQLVAGYETASRMSNYGHLNDRDVASLIAYLETLSNTAKQ